MRETLQTQEQSNILQDFLRPYFWEVDFSSVRLPDHETYVIERVIEYGHDEAIRWLNKTFTPDAQACVVRRSGCLSSNTATLWALVLDIPKEQIRCLKAPFPLMPANL